MKKIVIQGLGYVGLAMMVFCAGAKKKKVNICIMLLGLKKNLLEVKKLLKKLVLIKLLKLLMIQNL